jgi:hypothetical protein
MQPDEAGDWVRYDAIQSALDAAYAEGLREAAKAVCPRCANESPLIREWDGETGYWHNDMKEGHEICRAQAIERLAQREET